MQNTQTQFDKMLSISSKRISCVEKSADLFYTLPDSVASTDAFHMKFEYFGILQIPESFWEKKQNGL